MPYHLFMIFCVLIDELVEVELLTILGQQLTKEESIMEVLLKVGDAS